jgi:CBS domain-containing protein
MTKGAECAPEHDDLVTVARRLKELGVGALPICGDDNRLKGMVTDRDIVVKCLATGGDPARTTAGDLAEGKPVTVGADDSLDTVIETMRNHSVRRLPVIDGHELVGIVSQADVARAASNDQVAALVEAISEAKDNG